MSKDTTVIDLTQLFATMLAEAKYQELIQHEDFEYAQLADIDDDEDPNGKLIKSVKTARAYGAIEGIALAIEAVTKRKFKYVNPPVTMNGKKLVAVNLLGWAMYRGFLAGKMVYYVLKPGDKAMALEEIDPSFPGWVFLDPAKREKRK